MNHIASTQNALVKRIRSLSTKKGRLEEGLFALEGKKLIEEALSFGVSVCSVLCEPSFARENEGLIACAIELGASVSTADAAVLESASDTRTQPGVLAAAALPVSAVPSVYSGGLWVALDAVQDPGNLGAILRSADAMGASGVLLGEGCVDPYSPKAIRSAMGSTFHLPIAQTSDLKSELLKVREQGFVVIAAVLDGQDALPDTLRNAVLVIGNEGNGIRSEVAAVAELRYRLTMKGRAESLNAAVCTGILLYELSHRIE